MAIDSEKVERLVAKCQSLSAHGRQGYNESNTRKDFIEPLFEALGWNVRDKEEVDAEKYVRPGFADYAFLRRGRVQFFLESKKLEEDLDQEEFVRQVITYAYSKGVSWAVLSNFSRLVVFDAQEEMDKAKPRYVLNLGCEDYVSQTELLSLLTPESIVKGDLAAHAVKIGVRRRAIPIEKRLYEAMRQWRENLFNQISAYRGWKTQEEIRRGDEAIQRLLDRLIFLRNCEDRGIGEPGLRGLRNRIRSRGQHVHVTEALVGLFDQAARTYDSELFEAHALIDEFLREMGTNLDDRLGEIIEGTYSVPKSYATYDFALIDADVLGQVYEQYLGHVARRVVRLVAQPRLPGMQPLDISVEEKRQRRKERGIYYTPRWVVDYIVGHTVGRFLQDHADDSDAIAGLRILDPACGSASFLIRAYETLLEYHAALGDVGDRQTREWILRNSIFGVDLDPQAVEIARLNLLMRMVREAEALPPLRENIRLGNSLISDRDEVLERYFGQAWRAKRPFKWQEEYPEIMAEGGFHIIVGNPPYVESSLVDKEEREYYRAEYSSAASGFDLYVLFIEKALRLVREGGRVGLITSGKFLRTQYGERICKLMRQAATVEDIVELSAQPGVFEGAINYPVILILRRQISDEVFRFVAPPLSVPIQSIATLNEFAEAATVEAPQSAIEGGKWPPPVGSDSRLISKLEDAPLRLRDIADVFHGVQTNADPVFILIKRGDSSSGLTPVHSRAMGEIRNLEESLLHPILKGSVHMKRWMTSATDLLLLFPYLPSSTTLIPADALQQEYGNTWRYLLDNKERLEGRESGRWRDSPQWYGYTRRNNHDRFGMAKRRILTPCLAARASFSLDDCRDYYFTGSGAGGGGGYGIDIRSDVSCSCSLLLCLLNSKLLDYYVRRISSPFRGGYWAYSRQYLDPLPIIDFEIRADICGELTHLGTAMVELHRSLGVKAGLWDEERTEQERQIEETESQIDGLVYDLYGLTKEERALVEKEFER